MSALKSNGSVPSLPPPQPKSPPQYPDLYGKRRELARIQMLEREISFLEVSFFLILGWILRNFLRLICFQLLFWSAPSRIRIILGFEAAKLFDLKNVEGSEID